MAHHFRILIAHPCFKNLALIPFTHVLEFITMSHR